MAQEMLQEKTKEKEGQKEGDCKFVETWHTLIGSPLKTPTKRNQWVWLK